MWAGDGVQSIHRVPASRQCSDQTPTQSTASSLPKTCLLLVTPVILTFSPRKQWEPHSLLFYKITDLKALKEDV